MSKIENGTECIFIGSTHYDFPDKKTGERVIGDCKKAVLCHYEGGYCIDIEVVKLSKDCKISAGQSGFPVFDRFGKFCGFR